VHDGIVVQKFCHVRPSFVPHLTQNCKQTKTRTSSKSDIPPAVSRHDSGPSGG
jgi:hypothetical protein